MTGDTSSGRRWLLIATLLASIGLAGCRAVPEVGAFVTIVNRSATPVSIDALKDGHAATVFGPQFAACNQSRWGLEYGEYVINVQTATDAGSATVHSSGTTSPPERTIVIDGVGRIDMDAPIWPSTKAPCP